jgi:hypothetical protein
MAKINHPCYLKEILERRERYIYHPEVHGLDGRAIGEADGILVHRELGVIFSVTIDQQHCHPIPRGTTQICIAHHTTSVQQRHVYIQFTIRYNVGSFNKLVHRFTY